MAAATVRNPLTLSAPSNPHQMCERGTEVAVFDYADAGERYLGITAYVLYPFPPRYSAMLHRFSRRFGERCIGLSFDAVRPACIRRVTVV